jgi:hypothetical protein
LGVRFPLPLPSPDELSGSRPKQQPAEVNKTRRALLLMATADDVK